MAQQLPLWVRRGIGPLAVVLAAAALAVTACTASPPAVEPPPAPPPATSAPPPSPTPPSPAEVAGSAALDAYRGMWQDFATAGVTSDWRSPVLGQHATGVALTNLSRSLYADHANGLVTRGGPVLDPHPSSVEPVDAPVKVIVLDCGDSTNWLKYRASDGARAEGGGGGRRRILAVVEKQSDGSWKVSDYAVRDVGTC